MSNYIYTNKGIVNTDVLKHYGILGMKWGVRRYQNADGSLTAAGRKRYGDDNGVNTEQNPTKTKKKNNLSKALSPTVKNGKDKPNISPAEKFTKNVSSAADEASRVANAADRIVNRSKAPKNIDLSKMSDKELRDVVNRMNLERQYINAVTPQTTSKGKEYFDDVMDVVGGIAGLAGSVIGTIALIKTFKKVT